MLKYGQKMYAHKRIYYRNPVSNQALIDSGNEYLNDAKWELVKGTETAVSKTTYYTVFAVSPVNIPTGSRICFVCYSDGKMVQLEEREYTSEAVMYFVEYSNLSYDNVKILVFENMQSLKPICKAETIVGQW